jgi:hypothetical protein
LEVDYFEEHVQLGKRLFGKNVTDLAKLESRYHRPVLKATKRRIRTRRRKAPQATMMAMTATPRPDEIDVVWKFATFIQPERAVTLNL